MNVLAVSSEQRRSAAKRLVALLHGTRPRRDTSSALRDRDASSHEADGLTSATGSDSTDPSRSIRSTARCRFEAARVANLEESLFGREQEDPLDVVQHVRFVDAVRCRLCSMLETGNSEQVASVAVLGSERPCSMGATTDWEVPARTASCVSAARRELGLLAGSHPRQETSARMPSSSWAIGRPCAQQAGCSLRI